MPQFTYTGSEVKVFPTLAASDGSTLVVKPGDVVTLDTDPNAPDLTAQAATPAPKAADATPAPAPEAAQTAPEAPTTDATPSA